MVFSKAEGVDEKGKACQSHVCHAQADHTPFNYIVFFPFKFHVLCSVFITEVFIKCIRDAFTYILETEKVGKTDLEKTCRGAMLISTFRLLMENPSF